jgi:hypothetical protein
MDVAIEVKGSSRVHDGDLRGLASLAEEHRVRRWLMVSLEREPRRLASGVEVVSWRTFTDRLWSGELGI